MRRATIAHNGLKMLLVFGLSACAGVTPRDPLEVTVAGIESLPGEGMEMRMMVKLRVQNPNDAPVEYNGVFLKLDVLDQPFASGVSDEIGSVPRFGESVISVPITVSTLRLALGAVGMLSSGPIEKVDYSMEGKLGGSAFSSTRFQAKGQFALPSTAGRGSKP